MLDALLADLVLPTIWGEGALLAWSGLDSATDAEHDLVLSSRTTPGHFLIHGRPRRRELHCALPAGASCRCCTGDVVAFAAPDGELLLVFMKRDMLVGHCPGAWSLDLLSGDAGLVTSTQDLITVSSDPDGWHLALHRRGDRFALGWGEDPVEALRKAELALGADPVAVAIERLRSYRELPTTAEADLLAKCWSVMRVNAHGPQGRFDCRWSTPDRVPHRDCWLWDSVFHSIGLNHRDPPAAWDMLRSVLVTATADGMIPHQSRPSGWSSAITQPPVLAWGVLANHQRTGDGETLRWALPRLDAYLSWNLAHRRVADGDLFAWHIGDAIRCRCDESGMDNSPRFDPAPDATLPGPGPGMACVDFSVFMARDCAALAKLYHCLDLLEDQARWMALAESIAAAVHAGLWDAESGFYVDRLPDGRRSPVQAVSGFLPLLLPSLPPAHLEGLLGALADPRRFASPAPIPSVSLDHPQHGTDMWRGATWLNMDWLVVQGLRQQGRRQEAAALATACIDLVGRWYRASGVVFEFYDSRDAIPPWRCERKGPVPETYDCRERIASIRDYHWTAALVLDLLLAGERA